MRKAIQLIDNQLGLIALCDDGSIWLLEPGSFGVDATTKERLKLDPPRWYRTIDIPQGDDG